ncbi:acyl-CoA dehydratase activase [Desulfosporosinus sp. BICA1-9]|uniref:acyl-CoA dehydratase activase n=1 Tax=Desulfosporosinus sp. BICA1-9 TaxID=1531958 RepID=UPI00054B5355|nr:acyl-CoA dehydratase activase [Desulfosporosinus sp. BICA1-9]KJS47666.1 MAG: 2-hydroxyglutaryl-CoA dehydratase [Peptococcaceae bacterium BRH_c23]KJS89163.1 MAG: 2-hydroxyglutaryl-CoA dehydratase [Desulfosporosinus sp. BICA1-9]HBW37148.1 2-hydroxyglutaryl-CoA dehydratase [Desulfosporosinus sp.]
MQQYFVGVDIGSLTVKVVLLNSHQEIIGQAKTRAGYSGRDVATRLKEQLLCESDLNEQSVIATVATGYGRVTFPADREVSEITCQAKGIHHLFPSARTVIDIGGQDSKVIKLLSNGKVADFAMNDKCAAGTGRFLEVMASALEVEWQEIGEIVSSSKNPTQISSFCTVFAESEVISQVSAGAPKSDILAGVCDSVASRVASMTRRTGLEPDIVFTGGVAHNQGVVHALAKQLGYPLLVSREPVITAALGAALLAWELHKVK